MPVIRVSDENEMVDRKGRGSTVAEMHSSVAETDAGKGGSEEHLALRLVVIWVPDRAG